MRKVSCDEFIKDILNRKNVFKYNYPVECVKMFNVDKAEIKKKSKALAEYYPKGIN